MENLSRKQFLRLRLGAFFCGILVLPSWKMDSVAVRTLRVCDGQAHSLQNQHDPLMSPVYLFSLSVSMALNRPLSSTGATANLMQGETRKVLVHRDLHLLSLGPLPPVPD